jgi:DNA invertase Pin-like site-specific DNA recombinase
MPAQPVPTLTTRPAALPMFGAAVAGLGGLADVERDLIRTRTAEGRSRAQKRGVKMGRKPKLTPHQQAEAIKRRETGEPIREIARSYNVHNSTISRLTA